MKLIFALAYLISSLPLLVSAVEDENGAVPTVDEGIQDVDVKFDIYEGEGTRKEFKCGDKIETAQIKEMHKSFSSGHQHSNSACMRMQTDGQKDANGRVKTFRYFKLQKAPRPGCALFFYQTEGCNGRGTGSIVAGISAADPIDDCRNADGRSVQSWQVICDWDRYLASKGVNPNAGRPAPPEKPWWRIW